MLSVNGRKRLGVGKRGERQRKTPWGKEQENPWGNNEKLAKGKHHEETEHHHIIFGSGSSSISDRMRTVRCEFCDNDNLGNEDRDEGGDDN